MIKWMGIAPEHCEMCSAPIEDNFVDGKTTKGFWAIMCPTCHQQYGFGVFGSGTAQLYQKTIQWVKVEG